MAVISYNVPCAPKRRIKGKPPVEFTEQRGAVAYFNIGETRVKFVLQHDRAGKPDSLVHFASGMVFGRLNGPKLEHAVARGCYTYLNDRGAAETLIARAVANMGAAGVLEKLSAVPVINHDTERGTLQADSHVKAFWYWRNPKK